MQTDSDASSPQHLRLSADPSEAEDSIDTDDDVDIQTAKAVAANDVSLAMEEDASLTSPAAVEEVPLKEFGANSAPGRAERGPFEEESDEDDEAVKPMAQRRNGRPVFVVQDDNDED